MSIFCKLCCVVLCMGVWIELFCCFCCCCCWCCLDWVRFFDVYLKSNVWKPCCWGLFYFCLHMLTNTRSRFLSFNGVLGCLLSLDNDWQISLVDDFCRLFDKGLVGLGSFEIIVESKEDLELGSVVIDGEGFDLFPMISCTHLLCLCSFYLFVPGCL